MKNLIMVNGTMGVGKTATCRELQKLLPNNVFLDGDWCWDMRPFVVTDETEAMVLDNISYLLNSFIRCTAYDNIIFCWVMHEQGIIDAVLPGLDTAGCSVSSFTLTAGEAALVDRMARDVAAGLREADAIKRSVDRLGLYRNMNTEKIDVSEISPAQAARLIRGRLNA